MLIDYMDENNNNIQKLIESIEASNEESNETNPETEECVICFYDKPKNEFVIFECNDTHKSCLKCYSKLDKCPFCLTPFNLSFQEITLTNDGISQMRLNQIINQADRIQYRNNLTRNNEIMIEIVCKCMSGLVCIFVLVTFIYIIASYTDKKDELINNK
jgi:hypothetical protein